MEVDVIKMAALLDKMAATVEKAARALSLLRSSQRQKKSSQLVKTFAFSLESVTIRHFSLATEKSYLLLTTRNYFRLASFFSQNGRLRSLMGRQQRTAEKFKMENKKNLPFKKLGSLENSSTGISTIDGFVLSVI